MAAIQHERAGDGITILRLARPDVRNALDTASIGELLDGFADAAADPELRVLVLSTSSARAFCAGADVGETLDAQGGVERMEAFARLYAALDAFPAPVVCVCVGNVVGAGAELAAGSDLRVGGDNLKLAWAGSRLGVPVGPARLAPLIGASRAKDLIYTGRVVGMEEAREIGFLHRTAPAERAEAVAVELAGLIASHPPEGLRRLKGMFRDFDETHARITAENELLVTFQREGAGLPQGPPSG